MWKEDLNGSRDDNREADLAVQREMASASPLKRRKLCRILSVSDSYPGLLLITWLYKDKMALNLERKKLCSPRLFFYDRQKPILTKNDPVPLRGPHHTSRVRWFSNMTRSQKMSGNFGTRCCSPPPLEMTSSQQIAFNTAILGLFLIPVSTLQSDTPWWWRCLLWQNALLTKYVTEYIHTLIFSEVDSESGPVSV